MCLLECETLSLHRVTRRPEILSDRLGKVNSSRKGNPLKALKHSQSFERHNSSITIVLLSTESNTLALVTESNGCPRTKAQHRTCPATQPKDGPQHQRHMQHQAKSASKPRHNIQNMHKSRGYAGMPGAMTKAPRVGTFVPRSRDIWGSLRAVRVDALCESLLLRIRHSWAIRVARNRLL